MPAITPRKITAPATAKQTPAVKPATTKPEAAKPSGYILRKASTVAKAAYPLGDESPADLQYLSFLAKHAKGHSLDCLALRGSFPSGVPAGTYGNQTCAVNAGRIIRLAKLGYCSITAGTDKAPLSLAFTAKAQAHKAYSANAKH